MNLSDILLEVGNEGRFQILVLLMITLPKIPIQWSMTIMSFGNYAPEWCCVPENTTVNQECKVKGHNQSFPLEDCKANQTECHRRVFLDPDNPVTAVTEWDLVCDKKWILSALPSIQMGGVLVGALGSGVLGEAFGRKRIFFGSVLLHMFLNVGAGFSVSWEMFAVFRALIGICIGAYYVVHVPYILEFMSSRWRVLPSSIPFSSLGASLLPLAAWQLPDLKWMHFICAILSAPFIIFYRFMPESMRWLTIKGRVHEAGQVMEKIARINGKTEYDVHRCYNQIKVIAQREKELKAKGKKYTYFDIYKGWSLARLTIALQFIWFTVSVVSYGLLFGISNLAGNVYLNIFLIGVIDVPCILLASFLCNCIGRRPTGIIYFSIGTLTSGLALIFQVVPDVPNASTLITIMCIGCRAFIGGGWAVLVIVSTEVYPTVIRTLGYGAGNTAARVGGILAPFIINMDERPTVSYSILTGTCFICVLAILSLKETRGTHMQDTLDKSVSRSSLLESAPSVTFEIPSPEVPKSSLNSANVKNSDTLLTDQMSDVDLEGEGTTEEESGRTNRSEHYDEKTPLLPR